MYKWIGLTLFVTVSFVCRGQAVDSTKRAPADSLSAGEKTYVVVEEPAEFPGGLAAMGKFISKNLRFPFDSKRKGVKGQVNVSFVVDRDGTLTDIHVIKSLDPDCDKEAIRLISSMPAWEPGMQNGKPVKSRFVIPLRFDEKTR
jgi:periplasmic protein TonB